MRQLVFPLATLLAANFGLFAEEEVKSEEDKRLENLLNEFQTEQNKDVLFKIQKKNWVIHRNTTPDKKEKFFVEFPGYADLSIDELIVYLTTDFQGSRYQLRFFGKPEKSWQAYDALEDFIEAIIQEVKEDRNLKVTKVKGVIVDGNFKVGVHAKPLVLKEGTEPVEGEEPEMVEGEGEIRLFCVGTPSNAYVLSVTGTDMDRAKYFFGSFAVAPADDLPGNE